MSVFKRKDRSNSCAELASKGLSIVLYGWTMKKENNKVFLSRRSDLVINFSVLSVGCYSEMLLGSGWGAPCHCRIQRELFLPLFLSVVSVRVLR